jgi:plasmid stabilization system protein ParE
MIYRLDVSSVASDEADGAALNIANVLGVERAKDWYDGLLLAMDSLTTMLRRCALARENKFFSQEIRQLLYGRGRNAYRIVLTILEGEEVSIVRILRIRHSSQLTIGEAPEEET